MRLFGSTLMMAAAMGAMVALLLLAGCASVKDAGVASYTVRPMVIDGKPVCCEAIILNGKEYASIEFNVERDGDRWKVSLKESGVRAFEGQEAAAKLAGETAAAAAKAATAVMIAPAAAGLGAAAIGAIAK